MSCVTEMAIIQLYPQIKSMYKKINGVTIKCKRESKNSGDQASNPTTERIYFITYLWILVQ